jgi:vacuolar-type H+-ATPase catalytic subunit A/Vma1
MKTNQKLKKFRHNKKRNTAFLYEALCNELTKTIVSKDTSRQAVVMRVIQEHFHKGTQLYTELQLYNTLTGSKELKPRVAEKMVSEVQKEHAQTIDRQTLFSEQSSLIKESMFKSALMCILTLYQTIKALQLSHRYLVARHLLATE